ncbi:MAG: type II toxin-antitoxin system VapC family toxin, partial [Chloroflexota bacterium]
MWSLFARRVREGLSPAVASSGRMTFLLHVRNEYQVIALNRRALLSAGRLTEKHSLRTLDAIHLAAVLQARSTLNIPITFVSADKNQLTAAVAEAFAVDDPYTHP